MTYWLVSGPKQSAIVTCRMDIEPTIYYMIMLDPDSDSDDYTATLMNDEGVGFA